MSRVPVQMLLVCWVRWHSNCKSVWKGLRGRRFWKPGGSHPHPSANKGGRFRKCLLEEAVIRSYLDEEMQRSSVRQSLTAHTQEGVGEWGFGGHGACRSPWSEGAGSPLEALTWPAALRCQFRVTALCRVWCSLTLPGSEGAAVSFIQVSGYLFRFPRKNTEEIQIKLIIPR